MAVNETPVLCPVYMDRDTPIGNTEGRSGRRTIHVKIDNKPADGTAIGQTNMAGSLPVVLPLEQNPLFTDTLSSRNFLVSTGMLTVPTNVETSFLLIRNPSGSGKSLQLTRLFLGLLFNNQNGFFPIYLSPTITATGSALPISNTNHIAAPVATAMQAFSFPTASAFGTRILTVPIQQNSAGQNYPLEERIILAQGKDLLITVNNAANNMPSCVNAHWMET